MIMASSKNPPWERSGTRGADGNDGNGPGLSSLKVEDGSSKIEPWEPTTFISRGYNPYFEGLKPSFFMVLGSKGIPYFSTF